MGDNLNNIVNEFELKPLVFCSQKFFSKEAIEIFPKIEILSDIFQRTIVQLKTEILSEFIEPDIEEIVVETITPKDWFQHFKLSVFPKWLLKKFPAKTKNKQKDI